MSFAVGDVFNEYLVKRKNGPKQLLYKALIGLAAIAIMAAAIYFHLGAFILIIVLAVGVGVFFAYKEFDVEYEYCLTNNDLDIDKIVARERRRNVFSLDVKRIELLAPMTEEHADRWKAPTIRARYDFSSGRKGAVPWFALFDGEGGKQLLIFEPPKKMRDGIRTFVPRAVIEPRDGSGSL
ncbi:MAG: hypothetical protein IJL69_01375 [Oscillospiraceae bacterium]|nr:hypothetical protein [Oscillospiraceae bacterium]